MRRGVGLSPAQAGAASAPELGPRGGLSVRTAFTRHARGSGPGARALSARSAGGGRRTQAVERGSRSVSAPIAASGPCRPVDSIRPQARRVPFTVSISPASDCTEDGPDKAVPALHHPRGPSYRRRDDARVDQDRLRRCRASASDRDSPAPGPVIEAVPLRHRQSLRAQPGAARLSSRPYARRPFTDAAACGQSRRTAPAVARPTMPIRRYRELTAASRLPDPEPQPRAWKGLRHEHGQCRRPLPRCHPPRHRKDRTVTNAAGPSASASPETDAYAAVKRGYPSRQVEPFRWPQPRAVGRRCHRRRALPHRLHPVPLGRAGRAGGACRGLSSL